MKINFKKGLTTYTFYRKKIIFIYFFIFKKTVFLLVV